MFIGEFRNIWREIKDRQSLFVHRRGFESRKLDNFGRIFEKKRRETPPPPPKKKKKEKKKKNIYIYICMHAVKLLTGPSLGFFNVTNWAKLNSIIILCVCLCPIICQLSESSLFQKRCKKVFFFKFCVLSLKFEMFWFAKTL